MTETGNGFPLKELFEAQGVSNREFASKAGISFRAIAEIRSGEFDRIMMHKTRVSLRKRASLLGVMTRVLETCGESAEEWADRYRLSSEERAGMRKYTTSPVAWGKAATQKVLNDLALMSASWEEPVTKEDVEFLMGAQASLGEHLTLGLTTKMLTNRHKKG